MKVLLLAGTSRSGSTIIEKVLGSITGVTVLGEVSYLWQRGVQENRPCSCGVEFRNCPFWSEVFQGAEASGNFDPGRAQQLFEQVTRLRQLPLHLGWLPSASFRSRVKEYQQTLSTLYQAVEAKQQSVLMVDSSKRGQGFALLDMPDIEVFFVHLVRDPRAVSYSHMRRKTYDESGEMPRMWPWLSALLWLMDNAAAEAQCRRATYSIRLRYEDFALNPKEEIQKILEFVGLGGVESPVSQQGRVSLQPGHSVSGNPVRFKVGQTEISADNEWQMKMPRWQQRLVAGIALPLLRRYGYGVNDKLVSK